MTNYYHDNDDEDDGDNGDDCDDSVWYRRTTVPKVYFNNQQFEVTW